MGRQQMNKPGELYACLYVKELPAQALLRLRPELRDRPCVVMDGEAPFQYVCSLNTKARLRGMRHNMTRVEIDTFTGQVVLSRSLKTEAAMTEMLLECAGGFSPRVEDRSEEAAFLCCIDIAGTSNLFGPPEMLASTLLQRVRALGIAARIAVSSNLYTAVCVVKGSSPSSSIKVVASGDEATGLAPLPVAVLELSEMQAEIFGLWGIRTLGEVAALPEKELIARIGQDGKRLWQLARGELRHLFRPIEPVFSLEEQIELDSPVEFLDSLLFVVGVMLDQLILRATARILALASITITLLLDGGSAHVRTVCPALPSNEKQLWIKLLHLDLEAHPPKAAIAGIALKAESGSTSKVQLGLFSPQLPEATRLDVTLARIRAIVGEENVGSATLLDTHVREGFCVKPFAVSSGSSQVIAATRQYASMRQLRPPERASVTLQGSKPVTFFFRGRRYAIERAYGPWVTEGDWWNRKLWGLEQWDVVARAQDGAMLCCCMMRDLMEDQWQMAAFYD
jgi:protein ImuB